MYHGHTIHAFSFSQKLNGCKEYFLRLNTFSFYGHIVPASGPRAMNFPIKKESKSYI